MANTAISLSPNGASYACSSAQQEEKGTWRAGKEIRSPPKSEFQRGMPFFHGSPHTHLYPKIICMELTLKDCSVERLEIKKLGPQCYGTSPCVFSGRAHSLVRTPDGPLNPSLPSDGADVDHLPRTAEPQGPGFHGH